MAPGKLFSVKYLYLKRYVISLHRKFTELHRLALYPTLRFGTMEQFKKHKAVTLLLYLAHKGGGKLNKMKALKLVWLADRYHLRKYGRTITGDKYVAMEYGTVPSSVKDIIEGKRGLKTDGIALVGRLEYQATAYPDLDNLSDSDQEAMDLVIEKYFKQDQFDLSQLSHEFPEWLRYKEQLQVRKSAYPMVMDDFFKNVDDSKGLFVDDEEFLNQSKEMFHEFYS